MPRIKGRKPEATREAVLAAAEWAFAEYGYENATLAVIAQKAGVTAATLPYHFSDKKGLWDATIAEFYKALFVFAAEFTPNDDLDSSLPRFYDWALAHRDGIRVIIRNVIETGSLDREVREVGMMRAFDIVAMLAMKRYGVDPIAARDATIAVTHLMTRFITNSPDDNRQIFKVDSEAEVRERIVQILRKTARALLGIGPST
jgi:AcrR family transcriptional regulator